MYKHRSYPKISLKE